MSFMGMGPLEVAVILLVAFLVLGPSKSINLARDVGKALRDLRRSFSDVASSIDLREDDATAVRKPGPVEPKGSKEADPGGRQ